MFQLQRIWFEEIVAQIITKFEAALAGDTPHMFFIYYNPVHFELFDASPAFGDVSMPSRFPTMSQRSASGRTGNAVSCWQGVAGQFPGRPTGLIVRSSSPPGRRAQLRRLILTARRRAQRQPTTYAASIATTFVSERLTSRMGGCPKKRLYSPAELTHALVADLVCCAGTSRAIHQHSAVARGLKPELFLKLKRAHCSQRSELMMDVETPIRAIPASSSMCEGFA